MISAYVLIAVAAGKEKNVFEDLSDVKGIKFVNELYGEWDIIAKIEAHDLGEIDVIVSQQIRTNQDVKLTSTMIVAR